MSTRRAPLYIVHSRQEDGFTLVEMLVTIALIAVMSGLLLTVVSQFGVLERKRNELVAQSELLLASSHIHDLIRAAHEIPISLEDATQRAYLKGSADFLEFVALAKVGSQQDGLRKISLSVAKNDNQTTGTLIERQKLLRPLAQTVDAPEEPLIILENVSRFDLSYLRLEPTLADESNAVWMNEWQVFGELPAALRVSISIIRDGQESSLSRVILMP